MRLRRLQLRNYGCFGDLRLELAAEPGRVTLITAPNGAGKSVLRQAFHDLLFDIPMQSPMKFRHGYPGMALHADALVDGAEFSFGWERGAKTQRVTNDTARFAAVRSGVTPQQLESLFALDTTRLRKGGTDLKGGATLSEALLAGTGELASAKAVRALIEARRNENWGKGKSKPPLNAASARLDATRKRMRDTVERPEARERGERVLSERERDLLDARSERASATAQTRRLNRIALTRPHLTALEEAEDWLRANPDAPALPAGLDAALASTRAEMSMAQLRHTGAVEATQRAAEAMESISRDLSYPPLADRLDKLSGLLGEAEKASKDSATLRAEHAAAMASVRAGLRAIGSDIPAERAEEVIPTVGLRAEVQKAITEEAELRTAVDLRRADLAKARAALSKAEGELAPADRQPDGLQILLAEIRADRNPASQAEEVATTRAATTAEVRRTLALMPGWTGTAEQLRSLAPPSEAEYERLNADRTAAEAHADDAGSRLADLKEEDRVDRTALGALRQDDLPDTAAVLLARDERDRGMRLVLARAYGVPPGAAEEAAFAGAEPMPQAYERRVREADTLADRRTDELKRVQEAERLARAIETRFEALRVAGLEEAAATHALAAAQETWARTIAPLRLEPRATIGEVRGALDARSALIDALANSEAAVEAEAAVLRRQSAWAERLAACLGSPAALLAPLLADADRLVAAAQRAEKAATKLQAVKEGATRAVTEALEAERGAVEALQRWRETWAVLLKRLNRPLEASPVAVTADLAVITELEKQHRECLSLAGRIQGMQTDVDQFAATVSALACDAGQTSGTSPGETARDLIARASAASATEAAWSQAKKSSDRAAEEESKAFIELRAAKAKLDGVIAACGAFDAETAEVRIAASRSHADQVARRGAARLALLEHGDGMTAAALKEDAETVAAEEMTSQRQAAEEAAVAAQTRAEQASIALSTVQEKLDEAAASTEALTARADYEAAVSEFDRLLEDQLVLHVAASMLSGAVREVEDGVGGSVLARTSQAFADVTGGAYSLESHDGPGGEQLYAVEHTFPNERKALMDLSEGTRDQLYLSLRMEALRNHCKSAMAMPFVADDILQTFDDERAKAALLALCDLSAELQVVVMTHHLHLQVIAKDLDPERLHCIEL